MLSKEIFNATIIDLAIHGETVALVKGKPCACSGVECSNCDFYKPRIMRCDDARVEWANSEYLEPVDWSQIADGTTVWVSDDIKHGNWHKRIFAFCHEGRILTHGVFTEDGFIAWKYARLTDPYKEE